MCVITAIGSFFNLSIVISMLTAVIVIVQALGQVAALTVLRRRQPNLKRPYRMWLYPLFSIIALVGWVYVFVASGLSINGTQFQFILILEHFVFRRGRYNIDDWNTPSKLPIGWAALVSSAIGLVGVLLGAAQVYYVGPIARLFNPPFGMDIGFELGVVFAGAAYDFRRRAELAQTRR